MKSLLKTLGLVLIVLFVVSCAARVVNTVAHLEPVPTKAEVHESFSAEELGQGGALFTNNCDKCHKLFEPESRDAEKWNEVLKRMIPKAKLNYEEGKLVRAYIIAHSE